MFLGTKKLRQEGGTRMALLRKEDAASMERRFEAVRRTATAVVLLALIWVFVGLYIDEATVSFVALIAVLGSGTVTILIRSRYKLFARLLWFAQGLVTVLGACFTLHPASNVELLFAATIGGPFTAFSPKREKAYIFLVLGMNMSGWLLFRYLGHDFFGPPVLNEELARTYLSGGVLATIFAILIFEMWSFSRVADQYSEDLRAAHQKESKASQAKSEFLAAISHEIRTPLNGVIGMVEILENTTLTAEQRRNLQTIRESSNSLMWIVDEILDVTQNDRSEMELVQAPMRLLPLLENVASSLRPYAQQSNVDFSFSIKPDIPDTISSDAGRLRQILLNLIGNAIKYSAEGEDGTGGMVSLRVQVNAPGWIEFLVEDNGIGIEPGEQKRLLADFAGAVGARKRRSKDSGMGLMIVQQLIAHLGGELTLKSVPGQGSLFTVRLPAIDASGPIKGPSLSGVKLVSMMPHQGALCAWPSYVLAADCDIKWVASEEEFLKAARNPDPDMVFVLPPAARFGSRGTAFVEAIRATPADLKLLEFNETGLASQLAIKGRVVAVQSAPILPSEFWDALLELTGGVRTQNADSASGPMHEGASDATAPGKILVAEDNEINRAVLESQLEVLGVEATVVKDGKACLEAWKTGAYSLILTDCKMPVMDGFELTQAIRQIEQEQSLRRTPIIAVTANALDGEANRCLAEGMDGYVAKPVTISGLEAAIKKQLPAALTQASAVQSAVDVDKSA